MTNATFPTGSGAAPSFETPEDLVVAVYRQVVAARDEADFDPADGFDERTLFSGGLTALLQRADARHALEGNAGSALGFSPFLNRPHAKGMTAFTFSEAQDVAGRVVIAVEITITWQPPQYLDIVLIDEGASGWKVDDIVLKPTFEGVDWRLSSYLVNPRLPF